ncbi:hypothetical protein CEUSTIGMA_g1580.t1 [Chlamydomonas eustigma]|uniref:Calmodulin n=1 Tax=Chlamydomonas eustigma TaxID=1157962 RepID=A0A250WTJ1_9CHLO|nr:hypothetical protein CEUSTIGMA_g1580.t1 [Chlamydomonas eustigma]|eukprot:GAX74131.1 hypothetical protein CEUSTIGMA_g1580.t1 [Chlamydomonas eustigma]
MNGALSQKEKDNIKLAFEAFDADGSGTIELDELLSTFKILGFTSLDRNELSDKFREADKDGSGAISLEEFTEFYQSIKRQLSCTHDEAIRLMQKKPYERSVEEMARLRNYLIKTQPFFSRFTRQVLEQMCRYLGYEEIPAGNYLWRKGDLADRMCVVMSGEASVWTHPEGASAIATPSALRSRQASRRPSTSRDPRLDSGSTLSRATSIALRSRLSMSIMDSSSDKGDSGDYDSGRKGGSPKATPWKSLAQKVREGKGAYEDSLVESSRVAVSERRGILSSTPSRRVSYVGGTPGKSLPPKQPSGLSRLSSGNTFQRTFLDPQSKEVREANTVSKSPLGRRGTIRFAAQSVGHAVESVDTVADYPITGDLPIEMKEVEPNSLPTVPANFDATSLKHGRGHQKLPSSHGAERELKHSDSQYSSLRISVDERVEETSSGPSTGTPTRSVTIQRTLLSHFHDAQSHSVISSQSVKPVGSTSFSKFSHQQALTSDPKKASHGLLRRVSYAGDVLSPSAKAISQAIDSDDVGPSTTDPSTSFPHQSSNLNKALSLARSTASTGTFDAPLQGFAVQLESPEKSPLRAKSVRRNHFSAMVGNLIKIPSRHHITWPDQAELQTPEGKQETKDESEAAFHGPEVASYGLEARTDALAEETGPNQYLNELQQLLTPRLQELQMQREIENQPIGSPSSSVQESVSRSASLPVDGLGALLHVPEQSSPDTPGSSYEPDAKSRLPLSQQTSTSRRMGNKKVPGFKLAVKAIKLGLKMNAAMKADLETRKARGPVTADDMSRCKVLAGGEVSRLSLTDQSMKAWSNLLDAQAAVDIADGRTESSVEPRSHQPIFQGYVSATDTLAEMLLVEGKEAAVVPAAVAAGVTAASTGSTTVLPTVPPSGDSPPWPPIERKTSVLASEPNGIRIITLPREVFMKILRQLEGTVLYRSEYLCAIASKPPYQRCGPESASLTQYLGSLPSFKDAPLSLRLQLSCCLNPVRHGPGSVLLAAKKPVHAMFILVEGSVGMFRDMLGGEPSGVTLSPFHTNNSRAVSRASTIKAALAGADLNQGKAAHINALHKRVLGKKRRDNPLLLGNVKEDSEEGASSEVEDVENVEDEEEAERVEQEDGDDKAIMITSSHIRSAMIMANLIEGRDPVMSASDDSAINTNMGAVRQELLEHAFGTLQRHILSGRTIGEMELMEASEGKYAEVSSKANVVAVEPVVALRVSQEAYASCLKAYHSSQLEKELAFFEGMGMGLRKQALQQLIIAVKWLDVKRGVLLQQEGTAMHGLYFIKTGQVSILMRPMPSEEGRAQSAVNSNTHNRHQGLNDSHLRPLAHAVRQVALLGAGDYFGEDALACGGVHQVSCMTETDCCVGWLRPSDLRLIDKQGLLALINASRERAAWRASRILVSGPPRNVARRTIDSEEDGAEDSLPVSVKQVGIGQKWDMALYEKWLGKLRKLERSKAAAGPVATQAMIKASEESNPGHGHALVEQQLQLLQEEALVRLTCRQEVRAYQMQCTKEQEQRRQAAAEAVGISMVKKPRSLLPEYGGQGDVGGGIGNAFGSGAFWKPPSKGLTVATCMRSIHVQLPAAAEARQKLDEIIHGKVDGYPVNETADSEGVEGCENFRTSPSIAPHENKRSPHGASQSVNEESSTSFSIANRTKAKFNYKGWRPSTSALSSSRYKRIYAELMFVPG